MLHQKYHAHPFQFGDGSLRCEVFQVRHLEETAANKL
jgi:hypothetical protein